MFITTYSSLQTTPVSSLYRISHKDDLTVYSQHCCNIGPQTRMSNIISSGNYAVSELVDKLFYLMLP